MKKLLVLPLLYLSLAQAEMIQCKVVGITDGDTITCLTEAKKQIKVRLYQIDAPELDQPHGEEARQALVDLFFNQYVKIETCGIDRYKRFFGVVKFISLDVCILPRDDDPPPDSGCYVYEGDTGERLIENGYAWFDPFTENNSEYQQAEQEARIAKRGLWADKNPIPPWEWRKSKKDLKK